MILVCFASEKKKDSWTDENLKLVLSFYVQETSVFFTKKNIFYQVFSQYY